MDRDAMVEIGQRARAGPKERLPRAVAEGVVAATRATHVRMLKFLADLPAAETGVRAVILGLERRARERKWAPSTAQHAAASLQGALRSLPLYIGGCSAVLLSGPEWNQYLRYLRKQVAARIPDQPAPVPKETMVRTIGDVAVRPEVRAMIALAFYCCQRTSTVRRVKKAELQLGDDGVMKVRFGGGKTSHTRGAHSVYTTMPQDATRLIMSVWKGRKPLAGVKNKEVRSALRRAGGPKMECRGLRRGGIQYLESQGVSEEQLLKFSGHATVQMLRRYLNFAPARRGMVKAAQKFLR
jgi:integrase